MIEQPIILKVESVRDAGDSQDIAISIVESSNVVCYDRIAAVDYTNAATLITVGMKYGANEYLIESFVTPAAGRVVSTQSRLFVPGNYRPFLRVTGGVQGDRIALFVYGYISDKTY